MDGGMNAKKPNNLLQYLFIEYNVWMIRRTVIVCVDVGVTDS